MPFCQTGTIVSKKRKKKGYKMNKLFLISTLFSVLGAYFVAQQRYNDINKPLLMLDENVLVPSDLTKSQKIEQKYTPCFDALGENLVMFEQISQSDVDGKPTIKAADFVVAEHVSSALETVGAPSFDFVNQSNSILPVVSSDDASRAFDRYCDNRPAYKSAAVIDKTFPSASDQLQESFPSQLVDAQRPQNDMRQNSVKKFSAPFFDKKKSFVPVALLKVKPVVPSGQNQTPMLQSPKVVGDDNSVKRTFLSKLKSALLSTAVIAGRLFGGLQQPLELVANNPDPAMPTGDSGDQLKDIDSIIDDLTKKPVDQSVPDQSAPEPRLADKPVMPVADDFGNEGLQPEQPTLQEPKHEQLPHFEPEQPVQPDIAKKSLDAQEPCKVVDRSKTVAPQQGLISRGYHYFEQRLSSPRGLLALATKVAAIGAYIAPVVGALCQSNAIAPTSQISALEASMNHAAHTMKEHIKLPEMKPLHTAAAHAAAPCATSLAFDPALVARLAAQASNVRFIMI